LSWKPDAEGSGPYVVACWAEDFDRFVRFGSAEVAEGYALGWGEGGNQYGAGKCFAVFLSVENLRELRTEDQESYDEACGYAKLCEIVLAKPL